jgi:DNA-binding IclR family transcriptional regulator
MATTPKVPAVDGALRVLTLLASQRGPVAAATIATRLDLPRSTVYQLLGTLVEHGFVLHHAESRKYGLGLTAFELGSGFTRQQPLSLLAAPLLAALVDRTGESGHLAVLHGAEVVYVIEERARHRPALVSDVGVRLPAHLTATGAAMLAAMPTTQVRALYPPGSDFVTRTGRGPSDLRELRTVLADVRRAGAATEDGAVTAGLASVAVAVHDASGWPVASIGATYATGAAATGAAATGAAATGAAATGAAPHGLLDAVRHAADQLSRRLGGGS